MTQSNHDNHHDKHGHDNHGSGGHHYILPDKTAFLTIGSLLFLTAITVWTAGHDFGRWNFPIAMLIATTKALIVVSIFMNLRKDSRENSVIFGTSFIFIVIFIVLTGSDIFFRGDVYVKGPLTAGPGGPAKFKKPWIPTPEIVKHGKEVFAQQCTSCHGDAGLGNGTAAAGLNPPPRNFTLATGWKYGRKPSQIFNTLKVGSPGTSMASFSTLPAEDRWAVAHYVESLGPEVLKDETADWVKVGVDPTKDTMDGNSQATIPVALAMEKLEVKTPNVGKVPSFQIEQGAKDPRAAARMYATHCASCHGMRGEGAVVRSSGANPKSFIRTKSFAASDGDFKKVVIEGIPGDLMPGFGQFSGSQISELQGYVRSLTIR